MLQVQLIRTKFQAKQTLGFLCLKGKELCKTLELPWKKNQRNSSCIPSGTYRVKKRYSAKYKHHYHILNVPNRSYILIHHGNFYTDIRGCILVGKSFADMNADKLLDVTSSVKTMQLLNKRLPDVFELKIINNSL